MPGYLLLKRCALQVAVDSIPAHFAEKGIPTAVELDQRYADVCAEARRRLLVPEGGGIFSETIGTLRSKLLPQFVDETLPSGSDPEVQSFTAFVLVVSE